MSNIHSATKIDLEALSRGRRQDIVCLSSDIHPDMDIDNDIIKYNSWKLFSKHSGSLISNILENEIDEQQIVQIVIPFMSREYWDLLFLEHLSK